MKKLLLILTMASIACTVQKVPALTAAPTGFSSETPTKTPKPTARFDAIAAPTKTPAGSMYSVSAFVLYVRDRDGQVAGYLHHGDPVFCMPVESGWCMMEHGQKVWAGCLDPNPLELGCEAK